MREAIVPDALKDAAAAPGVSPAIRAGGFLFLTGATVSRPDGTMPQAAHDQAHIAVGKVAEILAGAGACVDFRILAHDPQAGTP